MPPSHPITDFVGSCPQEVRSIVRALRTAARANIPEDFEFIYHGAICYSPGGSSRVFFTFIAPERGYVRLAFTHGAELADPASLLEGTGARMRHVKVRSVADAKRPEVAQLIRAAAQHAEEARSDGPRAAGAAHGERKARSSRRGRSQAIAPRG